MEKNEHFGDTLIGRGSVVNNALNVLNYRIIFHSQSNCLFDSGRLLTPVDQEKAVSEDNDYNNNCHLRYEIEITILKLSKILQKIFLTLLLFSLAYNV